MGLSGRSWGAVVLVAVLLASGAVALAVALERPGSPRPLGPAVIVTPERTSTPTPRAHRRKKPREREHRRRTPTPREPVSTPAPTAAAPTSGASPVRSPSAPAAGRDDDDDSNDDDDDVEEADDDDEPEDDGD